MCPRGRVCTHGEPSSSTVVTCAMTALTRIYGRRRPFARTPRRHVCTGYGKRSGAGRPAEVAASLACGGYPRSIIELGGRGHYLPRIVTTQVPVALDESSPYSKSYSKSSLGRALATWRRPDRLRFGVRFGVRLSGRQYQSSYHESSTGRPIEHSRGRTSGFDGPT